MGAAFRRRDRLDARRLARRRGHRCTSGPASTAGRPHRSAASVPEVPSTAMRQTAVEIDRAAERLDRIAGGAPPELRLLVDRGAVLARRAAAGPRRRRRRAPRHRWRRRARRWCRHRCRGTRPSCRSAHRAPAPARSGLPASARRRRARPRVRCSPCLVRRSRMSSARRAPIRCGAGSAPRARRASRRNARPRSARLLRAFQQRGRRACRRAGHNAARGRRAATGTALRNAREPGVEIRVRHVAAGQRRARGPGLAPCSGKNGLSLSSACSASLR